MTGYGRKVQCIKVDTSHLRTYKGMKLDVEFEMFPVPVNSCKKLMLAV